MRIRKLTETECMRLMGFEDKDTQAMKGIGMSASAIYHCAGDSIVVPCLIAIFSEFFNEQDKHIEIIDNYVERVKEWHIMNISTNLRHSITLSKQPKTIKQNEISQRLVKN